MSEVIGQKHIRYCISCDKELSENNWYKSFVGKKHYKCKTCYDLRRLENRFKKGEYKPYIFAKLLGNKNIEAFNKIKDGYVYVISNPAWVGWYKVGMAVSAEDRCRGFQTSSPLRDYLLEYKIYSKDKRKAEELAHKQLTELTSNISGEWFKLSKKDIITVLSNLKERKPKPVKQEQPFSQQELLL